jgi:Uma2 family endonuclease
MVVRGVNSDYQDRHPGSADVGLIIEVADSSLPVEHNKQSTYAAAGIPCYWIVDLVHRQLECHWVPTATQGEEPAAYDRHEIIGAAESLRLVLDGNQVGTINVADILPKSDSRAVGQ